MAANPFGLFNQPAQSDGSQNSVQSYANLRSELSNVTSVFKEALQAVQATMHTTPGHSA